MGPRGRTTVLRAVLGLALLLCQTPAGSAVPNAGTAAGSLGTGSRAAGPVTGSSDAGSDVAGAVLGSPVAASSAAGSPVEGSRPAGAVVAAGFHGAGFAGSAADSRNPPAGEEGEEERLSGGGGGDLSAQIIRQQDAEEGEGERGRWLHDATWTGVLSEAAATEPEAESVNLVLEPSPTRADSQGETTLCKKPLAPENGYLKGDNYEDGGVVSILCLAGYTLSGPSNITCIPVPRPGARGVWLPQDPYKCLPSPTPAPLCEAPEPPVNGYLKGRNYDYDGVVFIFCEEGYRQQGPQNITCLPVPYPGAPGMWSPVDHYSCTRVEPSVVEIHTLGGGKDPGPLYSVLNHASNYVIDQRLQHKAASRSMSFEDVQCSAPVAPRHGSYLGSDRAMGATVRYECDAGFTLVGPDHATCLAVPDPFHHVAFWDPPTLPTCRSGPPSTLPLMLLQEHSARGLVHQAETHRLTDTQPDASQVEGLPTVCSLPKVVGPCKGAIPRFYFDSVSLECLPFTYGGCHSNDNNFETFKDCQKICR